MNCRNMDRKVHRYSLRNLSTYFKIHSNTYINVLYVFIVHTKLNNTQYMCSNVVHTRLYIEYKSLCKIYQHGRKLKNIYICT